MLEKLFEWFVMGMFLSLGWHLMSALMVFLHIPSSC